MMHLDIDLIVGPMPQADSSVLLLVPSAYTAKLLPEKSDSGQVRVFIQYVREDPFAVDSTVSPFICEFLAGLCSIEEQIRSLGGEVRLGIYYDLEDTIVFPVYLSAECIRLLSKFNVGIDSTGYPCSEEDAPTSTNRKLQSMP